MKHQEIEEKYRIQKPAVIRRVLQKLKARKTASGTERNIFYDFKGRLARSRVALRLRKTPYGAWLTLKGKRLQVKPVRRLEIETRVDFDSAKKMLETLGYTVRAQYSKQREKYQLMGCEVTIDQVPRLGWFVEVEGSAKKITQVARKLGLLSSQYEPRSYSQMLFGLAWKPA